MAISNPFSITYGSRTVGGSSGTYQLLGPYTLDKNYDTVRLVTDVVVVASSVSELHSASEDLEADFRKRLTDGDSLTIDLAGNSFDYTVGESILKVRAHLVKSGNIDTDRGLSRAYTLAVEGELPADDSVDAGLREIEAVVEFDPGRRKTTTIRGVYTATSSGDAKDNYESSGDARCQNYLDAIDSSATWELVAEDYTLDREGGDSPSPHLLNFTRQYVELLANQSQGSLDDPQIKDHRVTFTDLGQYPGDSKEEANRPRRVVSSFDCGIDIEQTTNSQSVYSNKVRPYLREQFRSIFQPSSFALVEERVSYDETTKRISAALTFLYIPSNSRGGVIEIAQDFAYREARNIDYTYTHENDEYSAEADVGFAVLERIWTRSAVVLGHDIPPQIRIRDEASGGGELGQFTDQMGGVSGPDSRETSEIQKEGWNVVGNTSKITPRWIGDPTGDDRIEVTAITETIIERFHKKPGNRTSSPVRKPPTTGS